MAVPLGTGGHLPQGDQPSDWRAPSPLVRQVHPPDARCTMADQPRRYWCTYQQHYVSAGSGVTGARTSGIAGMPGPHESGQPPAGDRPKERRAPSPGLEGTNPRTGWRFFLKKRSTTLPNCLMLTCPTSYVELFSGLGCLVFLRLFYAPGVFFSFVSASSFDWHGVHTLVLVGMSVSVCRDASLQFHAELWELMVMIDMSARTARRCSGIQCDPVARRECWTTRVARETVFQPLQSDTEACCTRRV